MKQVYLVRHCKAEGQEPDARLTAAGVEQAEALADFLADRAIDSIVSSPYERARCTIQPLSERIGVPVILDGRLTERVLSGRNRPDWLDMLRRTYEDMDLRYEGGESGKAATDRAIQALTEALNREGRNIVIVSHGNLISLMLKHFDARIGFQEWAAMSNPDVFRLSFGEGEPAIRRIWG